MTTPPRLVTFPHIPPRADSAARTAEAPNHATVADTGTTPMPATPTSVKQLKTVSSNVKSALDGALSEGGGLLRLAPCWVPRSFLQPGKRLKLHPDDLYAFGLNRGGIDERWFASTTPAANENRTPDEGLSYVVF